VAEIPGKRSQLRPGKSVNGKEGALANHAQLGGGMNSDSLERLLPPEKLLRLLALFCFVASGIIAASTMSHPRTQSTYFSTQHDLIVYFSTLILLFLFFYFQYLIVPKFTGQPLGIPLGYAQAIGCLVFVLFGALRLGYPAANLDAGYPTSDPQGQMLGLTALFGEITFVVNVVWSYVHPQPAPQGSVKVPQAPAFSARAGNSSVAPALVQPKIAFTPWNWPSSAVKLFAISAAFFWAGGLISIVLNFPSLRFPFPFGDEIRLVPFGCVWLAAGVPFALFAALYWLLAGKLGRASSTLPGKPPLASTPSAGTPVNDQIFSEPLTRIHFLVTLAAAIDMIRLWMSWGTSVGSTYLRFYLRHDTIEVLIFFAATLALFALNARSAYRRPRGSDAAAQIR
jgi:hypothetical protein